MNKKQLMVTSVLISLIFVLVIAQSFFSNNFESSGLNQKSNSTFTEYKISNEQYVISIPSEWLVQEENNEGAYISEIMRFNGKKDNIDGMLQVINTNADVEVFANNDFKNQSLKYSDSEVIKYEDTQNDGVLIKYNTDIKNGYKYKNECYYIKLSENQIAKVLFNIKYNNNSGNYRDICNDVILSIKQSK